MAGSAAPGLGARLSAIADGALDLLQTRLALFAVEVEEEGIRLGSMLFYLVLTALFLAFGVFALVIFLTILLWDSHRLLVVGLATLFFLGMAVCTGYRAHWRLKHGKRLFTDTVAELQRDREAVRGGE